ncbi:MAG: radical SAM protein [Candidatus Methanomethylophilaceae archaeon]|jgi:pyruvate formate lyase activating enzyme
MAFYNVTYNEKHDFATVHNYGCTFKCPICSYKLRSGPEGRPGLAYPRPESFLTPEEVENALISVMPSKVNFMGGEPTVSKDLPRILKFVKDTLGATTSLGHTNGCNLSLENIDSANVGLKAWYEDVHLHLTGLPKEKIYGEVESAVERGMDVSANIIYIPDYVDTDQIELTAEFLSSIGVTKFHIMGYIPVPGQDYRRPTINEMEHARNMARKYIPDTGYSHMTPEEVLSLDREDDRFDVRIIAGTDAIRGISKKNVETVSIR